MDTMLAKLAVLFMALTAASAAAAQGFPAGPVRMVIGYPPGGSADFVARVLADEMTRGLGSPVVVENRPGAGTAIASDAVAKARPDGQTLLLNWHQAIVRALIKEKLAYDPDSAFVPVSRVATGTTVLVVHSSVPADSLRELVALAKANPGRYNAASGGHGSAPHLALAQFEAAAGVRFTTIQYKGGGPATQSILAGDTQLLFATSPSVMGFIKSGKLKPLVVAMRKGSPAIPGIPGSEEAGVPAFESTFWFGVFAPAGTPAATVRRLHQSVTAALAGPEMRAKIASQGMDATSSASPEVFAEELLAEGPRLELLVKNLGARVE
ncbi:MAG: tripartite tricarboxylate transporter substrate binding protein [Betaproteobacteria bacterium]|nr:tripartite tricarboxylate transporter substrate binding protein [Betaproteobacteria bacterium]